MSEKIPAPPLICADEARLASLHSYHILDTPPERDFEEITELCAKICDVPIAVINFIDRDRQWFKSVIGLSVRETPLNVSICAYAILQRNIFTIHDTQLDERFANNPLVTGEPYLRFYAGARLDAADGHPLGTLCVLDYQPRQLSDLQITALRTLSRQVMTHLELRRSLAEQQSAAAKMREAAERLGVVLTASQLGDWDWDPATDLLTMSPRTAEIFGLPAQQRVMSRTQMRELIDEAYRERAIEADRKAREQRTYYDVEYLVQRPDGQQCWVAAIGRGFYDPAEKLVRMLGVVQDITTRKMAETQLRASAAHSRLLAELSEQTRDLDEPAAVLATIVRIVGESLKADFCAFADVEGDGQHFTILDEYLTEHGRSLRGRHRLDDFGAGIADDQRAGRTTVLRDVSEELGGAAREAMLSMNVHATICCPLIRSGRLRAMIAVHSAKSRQWTSDEVSLMEAAVERSWTYIERARTASDLQKAAEDRERLLISERAARSEAERASRIKDEFLATLSHELRTPLNAILGWSQVLRTAPPNAADLEQGLGTIERNARAQTQIIEDLLDMSRIISGKLRLEAAPIELPAVVHAAMETVRPAAEARGVKLEAEFDTEQTRIYGDQNRLQQVFWNLLSNAIKFTPARGRVRVVIQRVDQHVEVRIIDSGEGIEPDFLPFVFDRFRQSDATMTRKHGGLGLGLAIVKQLTELHGGSVAVRSAGVGHGATFCVTLPLTSQMDKVAMEGGEAPAASVRELPVSLRFNIDLRGVTVLAVDDEPDARSLVKRLLEDCGAVVTTASTAAEAVALVRRLRPDVLVSDVGMPGEDGYSLIRRVRMLAPDEGGSTPALALTAYARAEDRMRAVLAGFQMHVAKPLEPAELLTMVASLSPRNRERSRR